jgi:Polyketide cyclase / dehydrase and lipid transport
VVPRMRLALERTVPFPREAVFAWWTDFREDDHLHAGSPARSVRSVVRRSGNEVWLRDEATRPVRLRVEEHVTLDPPLGYGVEARYPGADVRYAYRFETVDDGTRISFETSLRPLGLGWILVPLTAWWWRRYAARDLDYHLARMADDLRE